MKTIYLTLFSLFILGSSIHAHGIIFNDSRHYSVNNDIATYTDSISTQDTFFNKSLRQHLTRYLFNRKIVSYVDAEDVHPSIIRNLVNGEIIQDNPKAKVDEFGVYDFRSRHQILAYSFVLIKSGDEYEILDLIRKDRSEIKAELAAYFNRHPEVSDKLLPVYVNAVRRAKREYNYLEKVFGIGIEKDKLNDSIYRFYEKSSGKTVVLQVIID